MRMFKQRLTILLAYIAGCADYLYVASPPVVYNHQIAHAQIVGSKQVQIYPTDVVPEGLAFEHNQTHYVKQELNNWKKLIHPSKNYDALMIIFRLYLHCTYSSIFF